LPLLHVATAGSDIQESQNLARRESAIKELAFDQYELVGHGIGRQRIDGVTVRLALPLYQAPLSEGSDSALHHLAPPELADNFAHAAVVDAKAASMNA
jgi:hypothetical protein